MNNFVRVVLQSIKLLDRRELNMNNNFTHLFFITLPFNCNIDLSNNYCTADISIKCFVTIYTCDHNQYERITVRLFAK